ncbi:MAG: family 10 glycosylhydrolase [Armatimonadota bacterium]|nr:family 10 glycosylhydrolase [bacterium]MDW8321517.1 family 10 glycosylhydrolase [Armatimonadota bacterium]
MRRVQIPSSLEREYRGVWVATVANIDWPSKAGLPSETQQTELVAILDRAAELKFNLIVLQVRPACAVLYSSEIEPWSEVLSGAMGKPPEPYYDPLAFAIEEAHKRGMELHAWFNPYRARHPSEKSEIHPQHISKRRPELVKQYGRYLWLDPGEPAVMEHSLSVMLEVVKRYDIDGVHIDDYFYPYKERDEKGNILDFPDEPSWQRYRRSGGKLNRDDWRRQNVDRFVQRVYHEIKSAKRWVKFGISPFGLWRPGYPPQARGFDAYSELYADSRKWLQKGWCDYYVPQLYFKIDHPSLSFPALLRWWVEQNTQGRHILAGNFASKVADGSNSAWEAQEIVQQIRLTRQQPGAVGNIHFSARAFMQDRDGICKLVRELYAQPALVPAAPWLSRSQPKPPTVQAIRIAGGAVQLQWQAQRRHPVAWWVVAYREDSRWMVQILPAQAKSYTLPLSANLAFVCMIDRYGNASDWASAETVV